MKTLAEHQRDGTLDPFVALRALQRAPDDASPEELDRYLAEEFARSQPRATRRVVRPPRAVPARIAMVTAQQILEEMLPASLRGSVSLKWIRASVPGKQRIGKQDMWPTARVLRFFAA